MRRFTSAHMPPRPLNAWLPGKSPLMMRFVPDEARMGENQKNDDPSRDTLETPYEKMNRVLRRTLEKAGALSEDRFAQACEA